MKKEELTKIVNKLKENNKDFTTLDLSYKYVIDGEMKLITSALEKNKTLITLNLCQSFIKKEGAQAIAQALEKNKTLTTLDLSFIYLGDEGVKEIAEALKVNKTLTTLDLKCNNISYEGAEAIAQALEKNKTLTTLVLFDNNINDEGAQAIAQALEKNKTLTTLDLIGNNINDEGAEAIAQALEKNKTLTTLNLISNNIGDEGAEAIAYSLEVNKKYIKEVANFLSKKYSVNEENSSTNNKIKYFNTEKVIENLPKKIKYFKLYQAINKNLLAKELTDKGVEHTEEFFKKVDEDIKDHLFQLSGVAKDPKFKILSSSTSRKSFKGEKNDSFNPNDSVKFGSKRKLTDDSVTGSSKAIKMTDVVEDNVFKNPIISTLISEFLGSSQSLFAIKVSSDSNVQQLGDNSEMCDEDMWE